MFVRKNLLLLLVAAALGLSAAGARAASPGECKPTCFKHPITGQLLCSYPCP
jgi:hypothetical protein